MDIGWLIEHGPCKKFTAGMNIACPGGPDPASRAMYILLAGRVDVLKKSAAGGTQVIASLLKGDVFGGREYFAGADDCTYVAGIDSAVYVITEESFNDLSWSRPEILFDILKAAYMPMRKMSAADRGAQQEKAAAAPAATAASAAPAEKETATAPPAAGKDLPQDTKEAPAAEKSEEKVDIRKKAQAAVRANSGAAAVGSLYPEGHKHYPNVTRPEYAKLIFPKEYNCPFCKKTFKDYRVFRSKLYESQAMRFDLRKYFTDFQTEWYDILTCRSCFFSTFHNYFTDPKPMQKAKINETLAHARSEILLDFDSERNIDFVFTTHYLAIICAEGYPSMGKQIRAKLWGNLSWLYEDVEDEEMAIFAAGKAAEAYEQVYTESRLTPVQEQITCLSIAGMQHRAGIDNNLKKFIFTAKTLMAGDKTYAKLAEDFMYELKLEE
ncbi:MAG: DUF2225 domain-containing protein [Oscillospiraceae bacterium]|nr:DUF2225 domain-containing protein [Oscillospiraceae bacterium]